jgi:hypothetical protein
MYRLFRVNHRYQMRFLPAFLLYILIAPTRLFAQETPVDVVRGRVVDLGGRPVAEAQIEVVSLATKASRIRHTDSTGRYRITFPEHASRYQITARKMGFSPVQKTFHRGSVQDEVFVADFQFTGSPLALSMVEITGRPDRPIRSRRDESAAADTTVPNPVAEILALKDSLHLSAVQIVGLTGIADSLHARNSALYREINTLIERLKQGGDPSEMAGTVAIMLQQTSINSDRAVLEAEKLLLPEQWSLVPTGIRERLEGKAIPAG